MNILEAVEKDDLLSVRELVGQGADINLINEKKQNALHLCIIEKRSDDLIEVLVENGCDINAQDINGNTPMHYLMIDCAKIDIMYEDHGSMAGFLKEDRALLMQYFLKQGANAELKNNKGKTASEMSYDEKDVHKARLKEIEALDRKNTGVDKEIKDL